MSEPLSVGAATTVCVTFKRRNAIVNAIRFLTLTYTSLAAKAPVNTLVANAVFAILTSISTARATAGNACPSIFVCIIYSLFSVRAADLVGTFYRPQFSVANAFAAYAMSVRDRAIYGNALTCIYAFKVASAA